MYKINIFLIFNCIIWNISLIWNYNFNRGIIEVLKKYRYIYTHLVPNWTFLKFGYHIELSEKVWIPNIYLYQKYKMEEENKGCKKKLPGPQKSKQS